MLQTGLLWFDDDTKRPLAEKVADAVVRYHERVGGAPTVCQLNPASVVLLLEQRQKARQQQARARSSSTKRAVQPRAAHMPKLIPDPSLPVNYFFVGRDEPDAATQQVQAALVEDEVQGTPALTASDIDRTPRHRKPSKRAVATSDAALVAQRDKPALKRHAVGKRAAAASSAKMVDDPIPEIEKRNKVKPAPTREATQPSAAQAKPAEHSPRTRTRAKTPAHSSRSSALNRSTLAQNTPPAMASLPSRKIVYTTPSAMQPPLPLLADDAPPTTAHRRRAS